MGSGQALGKLRIDKLLWFLRYAKTRGIAQGIVEQAHIRLNGRRVERCSQMVAVGDILVLPCGPQTRIIEILSLPERRGPHFEAQSHYRVLDESSASPLAGPPIGVARGLSGSAESDRAL